MRRKPEVVGNHRMVVVDDNQELAVSCPRLLRYQGHQIEIALNASQAADELLRLVRGYLDAERGRLTDYRE